MWSTTFFARRVGHLRDASSFGHVSFVVVFPDFFHMITQSFLMVSGVGMVGNFPTIQCANISGKMTMFQTNLSHSISHIFCRMCPQDILSFLWIHQRHSARIWSGAMIPQYLIILEGHLSDPKKPFWTFSLKYIFLHWGFRKWSNGLFWRWILLIQDQHGRLTFCSHFP